MVDDAAALSVSSLGMDTATRLYCVRKTLLRMLFDRGYSVSDSELALTVEDFKDRYGDNPDRKDLLIIKAKRSDEEDRIIVMFPEEAKVGRKTLDVYEKLMKSENVRRGIIVAQGSITPDVKRRIAEANVEGFTESELIVNIKENELVPEHQVLTPEQKAALLERYTLIESQLPGMQESDPVARYYGLKPGQVVKIIRPSETAGKYVTYRLVR